MRRTVVVLMLAVTLALSACAGSTTTAPATTAPVTTVVSEFDLSCAKPGVVRPNCGKKPEDAGDRGGALQITIWFLLVAALTLVFTVVFRSAKRTDDAKKTEVGDRMWS